MSGKPIVGRMSGSSTDSTNNIVALLRRATMLSKQTGHNQGYETKRTVHADEKRFLEVRRIVRQTRKEYDESPTHQPTQISELLVEGARVLLHENEEFVSIETVESLVERCCGGVPPEILGMKKMRHTMHGHQLERMQLALDRVIRNYLISCPLCGLTDLENYICDSFQISSYESLRVGPLTSHPLLRGSIFHHSTKKQRNRYSPILNWTSSIFITPDQAKRIFVHTLSTVLEKRRLKMLSRGFRKICIIAALSSSFSSSVRPHNNKEHVMIRVLKSWRHRRLNKAMRCWYTNMIRSESWDMSARLTESRIKRQFRKRIQRDTSRRGVRTLKRCVQQWIRHVLAQSFRTWYRGTTKKNSQRLAFRTMKRWIRRRLLRAFNKWIMLIRERRHEVRLIKHMRNAHEEWSAAASMAARRSRNKHSDALRNQRKDMRLQLAAMHVRFVLDRSQRKMLSRHFRLWWRSTVTVKHRKHVKHSAAEVAKIVAKRKSRRSGRTRRHRHETFDAGNNEKSPKSVRDAVRRLSFTVEDLKAGAELAHDEATSPQTPRRRSIMLPAARTAKTTTTTHDNEVHVTTGRRGSKHFPKSTNVLADDMIPIMSKPAEHRQRRKSLAEEEDPMGPMQPVPKPYLTFPTTPERKKNLEESEENFVGPEELGDEIFVFGQNHEMWDFAKHSFEEEGACFDNTLSLIEIRYGEPVDDENEFKLLKDLFEASRECQIKKRVLEGGGRGEEDEILGEEKDKITFVAEKEKEIITENKKKGKEEQKKEEIEAPPGLMIGEEASEAELVMPSNVGKFHQDLLENEEEREEEEEEGSHDLMMIGEKASENDIVMPGTIDKVQDLENEEEREERKKTLPEKTEKYMTLSPPPLPPPPQPPIMLFEESEPEVRKSDEGETSTTKKKPHSPFATLESLGNIIPTAPSTDFDAEETFPRESSFKGEIPPPPPPEGKPGRRTSSFKEKMKKLSRAFRN